MFEDVPVDPPGLASGIRSSRSGSCITFSPAGVDRKNETGKGIEELEIVPAGEVVFMKLHITISKAATQRVGRLDGAGSDRGGTAVKMLSPNSCDTLFTPGRKYWKRRYFS